MTTPSVLIPLTHDDLVDIAANWLYKSVGCQIVVKELTTWGTGEIADAIGWTSLCSVVVECKTSRSDFLADANKPFRKDPAIGLGDHRYFLSPPDVIKETDDLKGWGLLHVKNGKVKRVVCPIKRKGPSFWNSKKTVISYDWYKFQHPKNERGEIAMLASIARRLATSPKYMQGKYYAKTYIDETGGAMIATAKEDTDHGVPILPQNAATHITHFSNSQRYAVAAKEETPQAYKDALLDFPNTGNLEVVKAFDYLMKHAHTIRTALVSQSKDRWQIPDGYALVPIEATEQMLYMGYRHQYGDASTSVKPVFVIRDIYKAMIAAAPVEGE